MLRLAADVWSVGCMMFTMLTGAPPFQSDAVKLTLDKVSRVEYTLPSGLSAHAAGFIRLLLQKDPGRRPKLCELLSHPFFTGPVTRLGATPGNILPPKAEQRSFARNGGDRHGVKRQSSQPVMRQSANTDTRPRAEGRSMYSVSSLRGGREFVTAASSASGGTTLKEDDGRQQSNTGSMMQKASTELLLPNKCNAYALQN
jgi:serine/threonine protein kinase